MLKLKKLLLKSKLVAHIDLVYNKLVKAVLVDGFNYLDSSRNNIQMLQIPNYQLVIDMQQGFPLLTTKRIYWKAFSHELIWMLSGSTSIDYLVANDVGIWDKDAANFNKGDAHYVGRIYGAQWRTWQSFDKWGLHRLDQIQQLIRGLKIDLYSRRHIVTAWNPGELGEMALPPCHWAFEVLPCKGGFALKWHQRSCDLMLGIPFDIGLYALLGKLIEKEIGIEFITLIGNLSNIHFYGPHISLAAQQITRYPSQLRTDLILRESANIFNLNIKDIDMTQYEPHPPIKAELYSKIN